MVKINNKRHSFTIVEPNQNYSLSSLSSSSEEGRELSHINSTLLIAEMFKFVLFLLSSALILGIANAYQKTSTKSLRSTPFNKWTNLFMSDVAEKASVKKGNNNQAKIDYTQYSAGQSYDATVLSAKAFGIFASIAGGPSVLIPRSVVSKGAYEKLKAMSEKSSKDTIRVELINVSAENQTISAKYASENFVATDLNELSKNKDAMSKFYSATIVGVHNFGLFAEIDELGIEGLVPASKTPRTSESIQDTYKVGTSVTVKIDSIDAENKKIVFNMKIDSNRADITGISTEAVGSDKWMQGVVQSVSNFGLFVRPAGSDSIGLVHFSRIPRDLLSALKKKSPVPAGSEKSEVEHLFSAGDVVKVRVQSTNAETKRIELSMLPFRGDVEEDDDYIVDGRDTEEQEEEDERSDDSGDTDNQYNAEGTLLWWKGAPYAGAEVKATEAMDEELVVLQESTSVVEGSWRRMFEMDMRDDEKDFSSKAFDAEMKELEEDIGELNGLDEDMMGANFGISGSFNTKSFGSFVSFSALPSEWKDIDFFKDLETTESINTADLRAGKSKEQLELDSLLREVEVEIQQQQKRAPVAAAPAPEERKEEAEPAEPAP